MMMIQIEYPALALARIPLSSDSETADRTGSPTQHNRTERSDRVSMKSERSPAYLTSVRDVPPSLSSLSYSVGQSALRRQRRAPPLCRHLRRRRRPQRGALSLAPPPSGNPRWFRFGQSLSPLSLAAPKGSKCLACQHFDSTQAYRIV